MEQKKVIVCDLDGTLAKSKSAITASMSEIICQILSKHFFAVVSGGGYIQFQKQFLSNLSCPEEKLDNLFLFPTMGSACYAFDKESKSWKQVYNEKMSEEERNKIKNALKEMMDESGMDFSEHYGEFVEDRGSQITFSGKGQEAPLEVKSIWDPDQAKRRILKDILDKKIPEFEIRMGGTTSIDITPKGIDKAYTIEKIKNLLKVYDEDIIFVGDALYEGGNDAPVKKTEVDYIQEYGPEETEEFLKNYI